MACSNGRKFARLVGGIFVHTKISKAHEKSLWMGQKKPHKSSQKVENLPSSWLCGTVGEAGRHETREVSTCVIGARASLEGVFALAPRAGDSLPPTTCLTALGRTKQLMLLLAHSAAPSSLYLISSPLSSSLKHIIISTIMAPSDYIAARSNGDKDDKFYKVIVDDCPYFPFLTVDPSSDDSIRLAACLVVNDVKDYPCNLKIQKISGGITNQLYRVSGLSGGNNKAVLMRLFGAEGMIDRNVENATYAALAREGLAPKYFGRFENGRIEQWLESCPLETQELSTYSRAIATELGHLHAHFQVPFHLIEYHDPTKPALWTDIHSWMKQALKATFHNKPRDSQRALADLELPLVAKELEWLEQDVVPANAEICFCHNDVLAANILKLDNSGDIQLIDFEYGGINYKAFDIANHFNEYAGGTDTGIPDYNLIPTTLQQEEFCREYLKASGSDLSLEILLKQVCAFCMVNHIYWGLWGVNQAVTEGCESFDYLLYASNRIAQYYKCKQEYEQSS